MKTTREHPGRMEGNRPSRHTQMGPRLLLGALLALQHLLVLAAPVRPPDFDESYYYAKARHFVTTGTLPRARPDEIDILEGRKWGTADWRPPGFPLFAAVASGFSADPLAMKRRVAIAETILTSLLLVWLYLLLERRTTRAPIRYALAAMLALQPWTFEFVVPLVSDSLTAILTAASLLALARWSGGAGRWWLVAGTAAISASFLVRPDMLPMAPLLAGVAVVLRFGFTRAAIRPLALAAAVVLAFFLVEIGYRTWFIGRPLLGRYVIPLQGAYAWAHTWFGTEREGYENFVYMVGRPELEVSSIPARAFASEEERRRVDAILGGIRAAGTYTPEADRAFGELARDRQSEKPFTRIVLTRVWRTAMLWINTDTSTQHLHALSAIPRPVRRLVLLAILALRWSVYALACFTAVLLVKRLRRRPPALETLALTLVAGRTGIIGILMGSMVHRLILPAWIPLLALAASGLIAAWSRLEPGRGGAGESG